MGMLCLINKLLKIKHILASVLVYLCVGVQSSVAQTSPIQLKGTVVSAADGQALIGATIKITNQIAITNEKGEFSLTSEKPEGLLEISFLGYLTKEIKFTSTSTNLSIQLVLNENLLSDVDVVVSTGYQNIPKERTTGSFVHIDNELLNRSVSTDIISRLKGIAPSLLFDERKGGEPTLSVRGRSTIFANADPLIVVDNFPYEGDIKNINPNDVEDISILRDAAAASIWGVRAGNGVIVITTKKGKKNQPMKISVNSNVMVGAKPDLWYHPRISSSDFIEVEEFLFGKGHYNSSINNVKTFPVFSPVVGVLADATLTDSEKQAKLDDFRKQDVRKDINEYFYRQSINQQYAVNVQGGGERHTYFVSSGYDKKLDSKVGNSYDRLNFSAQNGFQLSRNVELNTGLYLTQNDILTNTTSGSLNNAFPYERLIDDTGNPLSIVRDFNNKFAQLEDGKGRFDWRYVPLDELGYNDNRTKNSNYRLNANLKVKLLDGLHFVGTYQYEKQSGVNTILKSQEAYEVRNWINRLTTINPSGTKYNLPLGAQLEKVNSQVIAQNGRAQLAYDQAFGSHQVNAIGGFEVSESKGETFNSRYYGYDVNNGTSILVNLDSLYVQYPQGSRVRIPSNNKVGGSLHRLRSWYFNGAYTYAGKYTLSGSGRIDQTNLFGVKANQRTVPLWSAGAKWDMHKEDFYSIDWLSQLSLRSSFGYNGNFDRYSTAYITAIYLTSFITSERETNLGNLPNPQLRAEKNAIWNLGADFALLNNRLSGRIDYYARKGIDLVGNGPMDPTTGRSTFRGNLANMKGKGLDIEVNSLNLKGTVSWNSNLFVSYSANKVTEYSIPVNLSDYFVDASLEAQGSITPMVGQPLFAIYSYPWVGLDRTTGDPKGYYRGEEMAYNKIPYGEMTLDDLIYHGSAIPLYFGSFRNTLEYGKFALSFNITYKLGYYFRRSSLSYVSLFAANGAGHPDYALRWKEPGDEKFANVPSMVYPGNSTRDDYYLRSEILVERGDHIRLQDVQLSYRWGKLQLYSYVSNIGILWRANRHDIDPDYHDNSRLANPNAVAPFTMAMGLRISL